MCFLLLTRLGWSQTPFSAGWSFENTLDGSSTSALVAADQMRTSGVNVSTISTIGYPMGQVGRAVNIQNWSVTTCDPTEHVDFTVTPSNGTQITMTSLSFYFGRSAAGPRQLSVRSSADGFSTDLFNTSGVTEPFQMASIPLTGSGFINQSGPVTFRIYACAPTATGGALRLDEVSITGGVLPVELLYFRAQVVNERVELAWATTWERNADRFIIERSRDLREFGALGSVSAKGTTDQTQRYTFTDAFPDGGTTYYRLKQIDDNGTTAYTKPVAVILDDRTPTLALLGNPVDGVVIRVATRNLTGATYSLLTPTGQLIPLQAQTTPDALLLRPAQVLRPGLHWLQAQLGTQRLMQTVLVR